MDAQQQEVRDPPFLRNVGLLLTYHCQASCAHCVIRAGPNRHEEVDLEDARNWIRDIASYRGHYVYVLSLTGGEPFSNLNLMRQVMEFAADSALYVSVVTNGFWGESRESARQLLQSLPQICFLSISTDVYHQKYIPFERVQNAIWATRECGIPYYVSIVTDSEDAPDFQRVKSEILKISDPENIRTGITFPVGRASGIKSQLRYSLSDQPPKEACQAASSPCIFPDGRVYGCIGPLIELQHNHPLLLGNLRETPMHEIFNRAETSAVLHALRLWGPSTLISMLREAGLSRHLPIQFVSGSICNACFSLLSNEVVRDWLHHLEQDAEFRRKVAYGRLYYLKETGMLELGGFLKSAPDLNPCAAFPGGVPGP
jgi:organic radical activating enzyme